MVREQGRERERKKKKKRETTRSIFVEEVTGEKEYVSSETDDVAKQLDSRYNRRVI